MVLESRSSAAGLPPPFCMGNWRQLTTVLAISAAAVLALALRTYFAGTPDMASAANVGGSTNLRARAATTPTSTKLEGPLAADDAVSPARSVAATTRVSFNEAVRLVQPATLAVRASYGLDGKGQLIERAGSAVVVDPAGYAITCSHVVSGATSISVRRFQRERWSPARTVASDGDLALLMVTDGEPLAAATLGDSSRLNIGDWVLAVGHPFQLGLTVTAGILSRRDASLSMPGGVVQTGLLQTDAAINEGSSGGPLVNIVGEVVGINSAIYAPTGAFSGASFAIPAERARKFVSSILGPRPAPQGWGLGLAALSPALAAQVGFAGSQGVVVSSVAPASAAARAQLAEGDVITKIAGVPVNDLSSAMAIRDRLSASASADVVVEFSRRGVVRTATLTARAG
jgi:S1-C subfamily serine protease